MARARNIKPSIMDNEELSELEPLTRLLFIYLWMLADREGRLEDRPKRIAAQALAYDRAADVPGMLEQLQRMGFIVRYEANGIACIQIVAFTKHQTPHIRETASALPSIDQGATKAVPKHNQGSAEPSPRSPDSLIPDTGYLIPDTGASAPASPSAIRPSPGKSPKPKIETVEVAALVEAGFTEAVAAEFIAHKSSQKAPLTRRAWADHLAESRKAGWTPLQAAEKVMAKGWKGFEAKYVQNDQRPNAVQQAAAAPVVSPAIDKTRDLLASQELSPEQIEANKARAAELRKSLGNLVRVA